MSGSRSIYASQSLHIDYFWSDANSREKIGFAFSDRGHRVLVGNTSTGNFLLSNGYDVIAFKSSADDWFQETPIEIFAIIDALCREKGYRSRISVANSMGSYGAIAFSKLLKLDIVVAYGPRFSALRSFHRRHVVDPPLELRYLVSDETIAKSCKFALVYDRLDHDRFHVRALKEIIPPENVEELILLHSGHGAITFLHEVGRLKETTLSLLHGRRPNARELRAERRRSGQYLTILSERLAKRKKYKALAALAHFSSQRLLQKNQEAIAHETVAREYRLLVERMARPGPVTARALTSRVYPIVRLFEWLEIARLRRLGFDESYYAKKNTDVLQFGARPILHFVRHGRNEGRLVRFRD